MNEVRKVARIFDRTLDLLAILAVILMVFIMLAVDTDVVMRYFFGSRIKGTIEVMGYCLLFITFLGSAWALRDDAHISMDLVINRLSPRTQILLNIITCVISAITCFVIAWYGVKVTWESFEAGYREIAELRTPQFLIFFIIPVGSFLLFIQFLREASSYLRSWRVRRASPGQDQGLSMNP